MSNQQDLSLVPGKSHYSVTYASNGRIYSYAHQLNGALSFSPTKVLEIGVGQGVLGAGLRALQVQVTSLDIQAELKPTVVGSVLSIPVRDAAYDVVVCCQVLEHLPWDKFSCALRELHRVTCRGAIISLPDVTRNGFIAAKLPWIPEFRLTWQLPWRRRMMPASRQKVHGHYWEIGFRGFPLAQVLYEMEKANWRVHSTWRVPELRWHRFFRLEH